MATGVALSIELTVDADAGGRAAYETFVARNVNRTEWAELSEYVREVWRSVARAVLTHVQPVNERKA